MEWYVHRRFSEFYAFRDTIVAIWPIFARIHFPSRRLSISASTRTANERLPVLEQFLRSVYAVISAQPLTHLSTRAIYIALQDMLDVTFRREGIEATMQHNQELFLNTHKVTANRDAEEEEARLSSHAMSTESNTSLRPSNSSSGTGVGIGQTGISDAQDNVHEKDTKEGHTLNGDDAKPPRNESTDSADMPCSSGSGSPRPTWRRQRKASSAPNTPVLDKENEDSVLIRQDSLKRFGMLLEDSTERPRRHSLFDDEAEREEQEQSVSVPPPPPPPPPRSPAVKKNHEDDHNDHTVPPPVSPTVGVEMESEHALVSLRSPSGGSPLGGGKKRVSSLTQTHLPTFDRALSDDSERNSEEKGEREREGEGESVTDNERKMTLSRTSSFNDRPRSYSRMNSSGNASPSLGSDTASPLHPQSYSRLLSKRLEVFIHLVLQVPTFRHIIDPFVKNFRSKILEWELDRYFTLCLYVLQY